MIKKNAQLKRDNVSTRKETDRKRTAELLKQRETLVNIYEKSRKEVKIDFWGGRPHFEILMYTTEYQKIKM